MLANLTILSLRANKPPLAGETAANAQTSNSFASSYRDQQILIT